MMPTYLILGAAKAGTTSLHWYLSQHPEIFMSVPKEPAFFRLEYERGTAYYEAQYFKGWSGEKEVGEAAQRNLFLPYVPKRIAETLPDAKLIVMVRNPVERAFSHYCYDYQRGAYEMSFEEAIKKDLNRLDVGPFFNKPDEYAHAIDKHMRISEYPTVLDSSYYYEQIERYLQFYNRERMLIILFEDFISNTQESIDEVLNFLEVPSMPIEDLSPQNRQISKVAHTFFRMFGSIPGIDLFPRTWRDYVKRFIKSKSVVNKPQMSDQTREWLVEHYQPHNRKLENITGWDLSFWA
jgi:hypothetical protein